MHLAQANVSYSLAGKDDPLMAEFIALLDEINGLAEQSPGFVWRYVSDTRDPNDRVFDDPLILFNMSVWESVEALHAFTYKTAHARVFAARKKWFEEWAKRVGGSSFVLWWVGEGHRPTVEEAKDRFGILKERGPCNEAFTFKTVRPYGD